MIVEHEPGLHALSVSPALARSGTTVTFAFRLRNHGCHATAPAIVRFVLDAALEPLGPIDAEVDAVPPGALLSAEVRARVRDGLDDRTEIRAQAMVTFAPGAGQSMADASATNVCTLVVRTDPRLDGEASGTAIERIDAERVRVTAWSINEGDGPARDVALVLDVPDGCAREGAVGAVRASALRLCPGDRLETFMDARIVEPRRHLRADGARVAYAGSRARSLPCVRPLMLAAELDEPQIGLVVHSGRATVTIEAPNRGWVDARDVVVSVGVPKMLRLVATTLTVDRIAIPLRKSARPTRAIASAATTQRGFSIALARVAARCSTRVSFDVQTPADANPHTIDVHVADRTVSVAICAPAIPDIRLRAVDLPPWIERGVEAALRIEVINAGVSPQTIELVLACASARSDTVKITLPPRGLGVATIPLRDPMIEAGADDAHGDGLGDGPPDMSGASLFPVTCVARADGREVAREEITLRVRSAVTADVSQSELSSSCDSGGAVVHAGGHHENVRGEHAAEPVALALSALPVVRCGTPLHVCATIRTRERIGELVVRAAGNAGCVYVPGSLTVDGRGVAESDDGTPAAAALTLGAVASDTVVNVAWAIVPMTLPAHGYLTISASVDADGVAGTPASVRVTVEDRVPFAHWSPAHTYFVDASTIEQHPAALAPAVDPGAPQLTTMYRDDARKHGDTAPQYRDSAERHGEISAPQDLFAANGIDATSVDTASAHAVRIEASPAPSIVLRPEDDWREQTRRLLQRSSEPGLLVHIFALRALFPNRIDGGDASLSHALEAARVALRDVFDRLFVKVRIPGFPVAADDIEDQTLRHALSALFDAMVASHDHDGEDVPFRARSSAANPSATAFCASVEISRAHAALATLATASRGAPSVVRTIVALLPTAAHDEDPGVARLGTHDAEAAATRFLRELDATLATFDDEPLYPFDAALTSGRYSRLDAARDALTAALGGRAADVVGW